MSVTCTLDGDEWWKEALSMAPKNPPPKKKKGAAGSCDSHTTVGRTLAVAREMRSYGKMELG
jgi:hypothetical protein